MTSNPAQSEMMESNLDLKAAKCLRGYAETWGCRHMDIADDFRRGAEALEQRASLPEPQQDVVERVKAAMRSHEVIGVAFPDSCCTVYRVQITGTPTVIGGDHATAEEAQSTCDVMNARAAIQAMQVPELPKWEGIESAPKDGTSVLLATELGVLIGSWGRGRYLGKVKGYEPAWGCGSAYGWEPTHWMPLPTPPENSNG